MSLPSKMSFLMLTGKRWAGRMVGFISGVPAEGDARTGTATESGRAAAVRTSRTATLV